MKMQIAETGMKIIHCYLFIILLTIGFYLVPCAGSGNLTDETWTHSLITPDTADSDQESPAVWEDRVVWVDRRSGNPDIHFYNVTSGEELRITRNETDELSPDLFGDRIVWEDTRDQNADIWMHDLSSGTEIRITDNPADQKNPRIWGDRIVWVDFRGSNAQIYLYEIDSGIERSISGETRYAEDPEIWQDYVVWGEFRDEDYDIIAYDLSTGTEEIVASDEGDQKYPSIFGDTVVFVDYNDVYPRLMEWNLTTQRGKSLTNHSWYNEFPVVYGDYVVFENQSLNSDLSLLDRTQGIEVLLNPDPGAQSQRTPDLWANRIVWREEYDIHLCTLGVSFSSLEAGFSVNTTNGQAPLSVAFTDSTKGSPSGWSWDFGDGNRSTERNPIHTYVAPGDYTVILTVHNAAQRDAALYPALITVQAPPAPAFSANQTCGPDPLTIQFTDLSTGYPEWWNWDFGDGESSTEQNPVHTYPVAGTYSVTLATGNAWGNSTSTKPEFIRVLKGYYSRLQIPEEGITVQEIAGNNFISVNVTEFRSVDFDPQTNCSLFILLPFAETGIAEIRFSSSDGNGFQYAGIDRIEGNMSRMTVCSADTASWDQQGASDYIWSAHYTFQPDGYPKNARITEILWEGATPEDTLVLEEIGRRYDHELISGVAYTLLFQEENLSGTGEADLVVGVDSSWLDEFGWRQPVFVDSDPAGAEVYVDSVYAGVTPLYLDDDLSPGVHEIVMAMPGYYNISTNVTLGDTHDSIHLIRIPEYGEGSVLNTTFLFHDPAANLDYYQAHSPEGLSRFGVVVLEKSGNPLQLIYLSLSKMFRGSEGVGGPVSTGGGGSGGGTGGSLGGSAVSGPTAVQTVAEAPVPESTFASSELVEDLGKSAMDMVSGPTEISPTAAVPPEAPTVPLYGQVTLVLVKNLSVVFVAVLVAVLFYLRWKKGGSEE